MSPQRAAAAKNRTVQSVHAFACIRCMSSYTRWHGEFDLFHLFFFFFFVDFKQYSSIIDDQEHIHNVRSIFDNFSDSYTYIIFQWFWRRLVCHIVKYSKQQPHVIDIFCSSINFFLLFVLDSRTKKGKKKWYSYYMMHTYWIFIFLGQIMLFHFCSCNKRAKVKPKKKR